MVAFFSPVMVLLFICSSLFLFFPPPYNPFSLSFPFLLLVRLFLPLAMIETPLAFSGFVWSVSGWSACASALCKCIVLCASWLLLLLLLYRFPALMIT